jgi:aminomethyltransferase
MAGDLRETPLHAAHVALGARMVPFAGFSMPVQYPGGIVAEHTAVREAAGIFDVSHMGEVDFRGPDALAAVLGLVTNDVGKLADDRAMYTVTCRENGGIVDDCIVYRFAADHYRIVINASNIAKDIAHFREHAGSICAIEDLSDTLALLAVQGPKARSLVAELGGKALLDVPSFGLGRGAIAGVAVTAARTGYTGEDGFELFVPAEGARAVWDACVQAGAAPIGLGARDTLRLEARLCLYGNDIDETTQPYEAGLGWVVKLDRGPDAPRCVGHDALVAAKAAGPSRKLVGFRVASRGIVRPGAEVLDAAGEVVGHVTSGGVAPTVGGSIGMAYVPAAMADRFDAPLRLRQRGKELEASLVKGPFYKRPNP